MSTAATRPGPRWSVVVPVKRLSVAKSRLAVLGDDVRLALALAFAEDVVRAALQCPSVVRTLVVTDDAAAAAAVRRLGADVVDDRPDAGLNAALRHGEQVLRRSDPASGVAALSADLPAAHPQDLEAVLSAVHSRGVVADTSGAGTTLLAAGPGHRLGPRFGPRSMAEHVASGAVPLTAQAGLRRDVDTPDDLREALALGAGPRTRAVAAPLALVPGAVVGTMGA